MCFRHFISSTDDVPVVHPRQTQLSDTESPSLISYFFIVWGSICSQGISTIHHMLKLVYVKSRLRTNIEVIAVDVTVILVSVHRDAVMYLKQLMPGD